MCGHKDRRSATRTASDASEPPDGREVGPGPENGSQGVPGLSNRQCQRAADGLIKQAAMCEGCSAPLPVLTDDELAALPELMPAVCEGCLAADRVEHLRLAHGGDR